MDDDRIADIVAQWGRERPDLDPSPLLIIGRIQQLAAVLDAALRPPFAAADLGNGDFDVLAALRREGEPYTLTAGQLSHRMLVTTGAVTKRVDRLIARGLVSRSISRADARGRVVGLTPAGVALTDRLIEEHLANEAAILRDLSDSDRRTLGRLLAAMNRTLGSGSGTRGRGSGWMTPSTVTGQPSDYHSAMDDTTGGVRIRRGDPGDAPAVLGMLDSAVVWMNARGNTEQWGTAPFSEKPERVEQVDRYLTEHLPYIAEVDGTPAAALVLDSGPDPRAPITPAQEPERFVRLLVSDRRFAGQKLGAALLAHAVDETRRAGVRLLRVDCWAGGGGELVAYYERHGFTRTETFLAGTWPGQVLAQRVD